MWLPFLTEGSKSRTSWEVRQTGCDQNDGRIMKPDKKLINTKRIYAWSREGFPGGSVVRNLPATARDTRFDPWVREDTLDKEMASHSTILAREIPRTEKPGRLQSVGSQRVRHDLVTEDARAHTHTRSMEVKCLSFWERKSGVTIQVVRHFSKRRKRVFQFSFQFQCVGFPPKPSNSQTPAGICPTHSALRLPTWS